MALNIFQTYKYHELIDKKFNLYKVSNDGNLFGITKGNLLTKERVPMKYEELQYYRIDRILAKYKGKYGFVSADIISPFYHDRIPSYYFNDYEIVIPFFFDSVVEKENNIFEVTINGTTFNMDIEGVVRCEDLDLFKKVFDPLYVNKGHNYFTEMYMAECMNYNIIGNSQISLLNSNYQTSNGSYVTGRGWRHLTNEGIDRDYDYEELVYFGVINNEGKCIVPSLFEKVDELTDIFDGFYLAKFRDYYSEGSKEEYAEGNGDLYLFTKEGECVLAGFSDIVMENENTIRVYLKNYKGLLIDGYIKDELEEYDSPLYILLNRDFKLEEIPNSVSSCRNAYLDLFGSNDNPFRPSKEILQRLNLHIAQMSLLFTRYDEGREKIDNSEDINNEYNPPIDDYWH